MRRTPAAALLASLVMVANPPVLAETVVVGYITPSGEVGSPNPSEPAAVVEAEGVVVNALEPGRSDVESRDECPVAGCGYQLLLVNPAAIQRTQSRNQASTENGCDTLDSGVVDAMPERKQLGGSARLYVGRGEIPAQTLGRTGTSGTPTAAGLGLLCFSNPFFEDGLLSDDRAGPLVATQPAPIAILYTPGQGSGTTVEHVPT